MSDYLETEHVLRSAGYRVTMHDSGVSFEDTANPGEAIHLEPGDDAMAAQEFEQQRQKRLSEVEGRQSKVCARHTSL
jgi:hypothetical protein